MALRNLPVLSLDLVGLLLAQLHLQLVVPVLVLQLADFVLELSQPSIVLLGKAEEWLELKH